MKEAITITKTEIQKGTIGHSKWLKHKESRFNSLFPKRLEKVYSTIRSLSKLSNRNNYFYETSNIFTALSSIVFELRELAASYGLESSDIKIDIYSLSGQQKNLKLKTNDINAEVEVIYQSVDNLHKACPDNLGDWYFTGDYPTYGGHRVVNEAFINFYEGNNKRAY